MSPDPESMWLLLIYTVPRSPSRKRATVWRELKKAGAVYLRDGVCVLPAHEATSRMMGEIAARVREFDGQATIATSRLDAATTAFIVGEASAARAAEYAEVAREAERFLEHVERERDHRALTYVEVEELEADLEKLRRWLEQVRTRDFFSTAGEHERVSALLARCDAALGRFLDAVYAETDE